MVSAVSLEEELRHAETYEDYLDSFITETDRTYLQDVGFMHFCIYLSAYLCSCSAWHCTFLVLRLCTSLCFSRCPQPPLLAAIEFFLRVRIKYESYLHQCFTRYIFNTMYDMYFIYYLCQNIIASLVDMWSSLTHPS